MKIQASFVKDGKWRAAWTDDVPGTLTQVATPEALTISQRSFVCFKSRLIDLSSRRARWSA